MRHSIITSRRLLIGVAALAIATPALSQTGAEQTAQASNEADDANRDVIIVTATKRASTVQDVPFSINAQTQEDIQRANASTIEDISRNVAGLAVQNLGPGQSQVSVRGVSAGQIVRDQPGVKEQVGVYLDESVISLSLFTPDFDLFDLNRVETLRGPQGTLFGSGSVGGTIRYITNQPTTKRNEGLVEANINTVADGEIGGHLKGMINLPLSEKTALRLVGYHTKYAGFIDAVGPAGGEDVNDGNRTGFRASLSAEMLPGLTVTPRLAYQEVKANGFNREEFFSIFANPLTTTRPAYTFDERQQYLLLREKFSDKTLLSDLVVNADLGGVDLTSVSSFIHRDLLVSRDASALTGSVSDDIGLPDAAVLLPSNLRDTTELKQYTQEVRLASTGAGPLQWVIGGFYSNVDRDYAQRLPTPGYDAFLGGVSGGVYGADSPYNSDLAYKIKQTALFGEATYDFGQFKLTGGGRYYNFKEDRTFVSGGVFSDNNDIAQSTKSSGFTPRVIATWEPSKDLSLNLQASKGFRLGGSNDPLNLPLCSAQDKSVFAPFAGSYDDETLWNYEAGVKYQHHGVTFNAAAYRTNIKDLQVTLDAGSCSSRLVFNVDKAHTQGVETEIGLHPVKGLDLSFSGSLLSAEFDTTLPGTLAASTGIRDGNRLPSVPKYQVAASATYGQDFGEGNDWYVNATYQRVGNRYTQPADQEGNPRIFAYRADFGGIPAGAGTSVNLLLPSYDLVNISAGIGLDSGLDITVYANNLFDKNPLLSFDRERGGRARLAYNIGQPRQIGLTLRQAFGKR